MPTLVEKLVWRFVDKVHFPLGCSYHHCKHDGCDDGGPAAGRMHQTTQSDVISPLPVITADLLRDTENSIRSGEESYMYSSCIPCFRRGRRHDHVPLGVECPVGKGGMTR